MTERARNRILDAVTGSLVGALVAAALLAFSLGRQVDKIDFRLAQVERYLQQITRIEVVNPHER